MADVTRPKAGSPEEIIWLRGFEAGVIQMRQDTSELRRLLARYRDETPLGHQPHMIAHEADAVLGRTK